jgi:putative membrane protein
MVLSVVVFGVVVILYSLPKQDHIPEWAKSLPLLNACINGTCSALLVASLLAIRGKKVQLHKKLNITTFVLSSLFLVSYIVFHSFGVETKFPEDNPIRPFYLFILLTHIILAAIVLPLVLVSFYFGLTGKIESHRKVSKFTFPVWLYVTVTGVVVYVMISPYYHF